MDFGVHLPIVFRGGKAFGLDYLTTFVKEAEQLGYTHLAINDHIAYPQPLLDGPTALIAVAGATTRMHLVTSILLVNLRGVATSAKMLATLDVLSGGRVIAGIGPGSTPRDAEVTGVNFDNRWRQFDEAAKALRSLLHPGEPPFKGKFYSTEGMSFEPYPLQPSLPLWVGSWGSDAGLRRVARLGDGWLASGGSAAPNNFAGAKAQLDAYLRQEGKDPAAFPNAVSTTMTYVTDNQEVIERASRGSERGRHAAEDNRQRSLIGPASECIEKLHAWKEAGAQTIYLRPLDDDLEQIHIFMDKVASRVP